MRVGFLLLIACSGTPAAKTEEAEMSPMGPSGEAPGPSSGPSGLPGPSGVSGPSGHSGPHGHTGGVSPTGLDAWVVIPGGTFNRDGDASYPATVSAFKLDVYEVTVGRFRAFVAAGKGTQADPPAVGAGAHPRIANSGWDSDFNGKLSANTAALKANLAHVDCAYGLPSWTDAPGANEARPITCVTWYDAMAFCAWDGGRLPTEAEWLFAAAGGSENRAYPWGGEGYDETSYVPYAAADCTYDGSAATDCALNDLPSVGSHAPTGNAKWGNADMAGSVWEYVLDRYAAPFANATCDDCADLVQSDTDQCVFRGGAFVNAYYYHTTTSRIGDSLEQRDSDVGFRCARD